LLIRNGVDVQRFAPDCEVRARVRRQLGLSSDAIVIGSVGRLTQLKDFPTLLRAVETLLERGEECTLLLVGSGPEEDALRKQAAASRLLRDRIIFTGVSKEVSSLVKAMDVFALPSICEGMSYTLVEAMATGLPVVASRIGGNTELIEDHATGYLCTPSAAGELADRLQELIKNPERRRAFGEAARKRAEENFSLERMLAEYRDLYLGLARKRGLLAPSQA
jgi:glycosyltransferase involved in cell wall biosynthesis